MKALITGIAVYCLGASVMGAWLWLFEIGKMANDQDAAAWVFPHVLIGFLFFGPINFMTENKDV